MEKGFENKKITAKAEGKIEAMIETLRSELGKDITVEDAPDAVIVSVTDKEGGVRRMGFTKMHGGEIPIGEHPKFHPLHEVIEARLRFPDDEVEDAIQKTDALKKEKGA